MTAETTIKVLFVCAGNICRSPMAEAVFRDVVNRAGMARRFEIASVGTGGWHTGEKPHPGTQAVLQRYGIAVGDKRAQRIARTDMSYYRYIIAMDAENLRDVGSLGMPADGELHRLLDFAPAGSVGDVPDPYYSGDFEQVYTLVTAGCRGLFDHICRREGLL